MLFNTSDHKKFSMRAICLWSGPRNVSTAFMYSFAQRPDTCVVDEPLYGHFLRVTGALHPGREEVMASVDCDGDKVMRKLLTHSIANTDLLFMKQMAHHLVGVNRSFLSGTENIFLIRDPEYMLPSLTRNLPFAQLSDTGLKVQWDLFEELMSRGQTPVVIESNQLLLEPERVLCKLCEHLGIEFFDEMLNWDAGPRSEDGIWAKYWYQSVHQSTGFTSNSPKGQFPKHLSDLLAECRPWYDKLCKHAISADSGG